jgi:signal transduction histidine kinase
MKLFSNKKSFQPRSRLLLQLGDKLIKNENIALLELIKNSYDADAKTVTVTLEFTEETKSGFIDVLDDGEGMDINVIQDVWLEPGSDNKEELSRKKIRTSRFKRLPIGEKGIGRFGVHKLGYEIELISRKKNCNEVVVKIDWKKFAENKYLKDSEFEVYENTEPEYFKGSRTGTRIRITDLRTVWNKKMIRDLYKSGINLQSPFEKPGNFKIEWRLNHPEYIEDLPTWDDIKKFSLFYFKCKLEGSSIKKFEYKFTPWAELYKVDAKTITEADDIIIENDSLVEVIKEPGKKKVEKVINLEKNYSDNPSEIKRIGPIEMEGYIFDRDKNILELYDHPNIKILKDYLDEQGGVRVYREHIRINEYGELGNDWLNLDSRRVNEPTRKISNNILLSVIEIKRDTSLALEEKTNREGFVENEAFHDFKAAILHIVKLVEKLREIDKSEIRAKYGQKEQAEPVIHHLEVLKDIIDEKVLNEEDNALITKQIEKIEDDYQNIQDTLLTSAGAGLTLAIGLHEIEKVIAEANALLQFEKVPDKIKELIKRVDTLMDNYSTILRSDENEENNIVKLIDICLFNIEYRLRKHGVLVIPLYNEKSTIMMGKCIKKFTLGAIINILDNSIYWLHVKEEKLRKQGESFTKKILIDIKDSGGYYEILIADNGTGFSIPTTQITHPFITSKAHGMGLGLHIVSLLMKAQDGYIDFPDQKEYALPKEFWSGAFVSLKIKKLLL